MTPFRPSGTIRIDNDRMDVVTHGSYIDKDKKVKIVKVEGSRIVVREFRRRGGKRMIIRHATITLIVGLVLHLLS